MRLREFFKQPVNELFDNPLPYKWVVDTENEKKAKFRINYSVYEVKFIPNQKGIWECMFYYVDLEFNAPIFTKTGTGNSAKIFSTVLSCLKEFISKYQPEGITFKVKQDANTTSKTKLYDKLISRYVSSELAGYTIKKKFNLLDYVSAYVIQRNKQPVNELFDNPLPYTLKPNDPDIRDGDVVFDYIGKFTINDHDYTVIFSRITNYWDIGFHMDNIWIETNTGNEFAVFSTVVDMIKRFIDIENPKIFKFSAGGHSRIKLYTAMAKQLVKDSEYSLEYRDIGPYERVFNFTRKTPINELFDNPVPAKWTDRGYRKIVNFSINGIKYNMEFEKETEQEWGCAFAQMKAFKRNFDITNLKQEFKVFSTVVSLMKKFIKEVKPPILTFEAARYDSEGAENSRIALYSKMINKMLPEFPEYTVEHYQTLMSTTFVIRHKDAKGI